MYIFDLIGAETQGNHPPTHPINKPLNALQPHQPTNNNSSAPTCTSRRARSSSSAGAPRPPSTGGTSSSAAPWPPAGSSCPMARRSVRGIGGGGDLVKGEGGGFAWDMDVSSVRVCGLVV